VDSANLLARERSWGRVGRPGWHQRPSSSGTPTPRPPARRAEVFAAAPPRVDPLRLVQHTLSIVRTVVKVVEDHKRRIPRPLGGRGPVREADPEVLDGRSPSAPREVYARAGPSPVAPGTARIEALPWSDALVRGQIEDDLPSRAAPRLEGGADARHGRVDRRGAGRARIGRLRRSIRRSARGALVGHPRRGPHRHRPKRHRSRPLADALLPNFGPGPVVIGPKAVTLVEVARATRGRPRRRHRGPGMVPHPPAREWPTTYCLTRVLVGDPTAAGTAAGVRLRPDRARLAAPSKRPVGAFLDCGRSLELTAKTSSFTPTPSGTRLKKVVDLTGWDALATRDAKVLSVAFSARAAAGLRANAPL